MSGLTAGTAESHCGAVKDSTTTKFAPTLETTQEAANAPPAVAADNPNGLEFVGAFLADCNVDYAATWVSSVPDPPDHVVYTTVMGEDVGNEWGEKTAYHSHNFNSHVSVHSPILTSSPSSSQFVPSSSSFFTDVSVFLDDDYYHDASTQVNPNPELHFFDAASPDITTQCSDVSVPASSPHTSMKIVFITWFATLWSTISDALSSRLLFYCILAWDTWFIFQSPHHVLP